VLILSMGACSNISYPEEGTPVKLCYLNTQGTFKIRPEGVRERRSKNHASPRTRLNPTCRYYFCRVYGKNYGADNGVNTEHVMAQWKELPIIICAVCEGGV
jgi:hypothetical protein